MLARMNKDLQLPLAQVRRIEQFQQTTVNWLLPADLSPLEGTEEWLLHEATEIYTI